MERNVSIDADVDNTFDTGHENGPSSDRQGFIGGL